MVGKPLAASSIQYKGVRKAVEKLLTEGWVLRKEGHGARLYCPCGSACTTIPVAGTPGNEGNLVRRIVRMARRCPLPPGDPNRSLTGLPRE
jgi:hypothetical protein